MEESVLEIEVSDEIIVYDGTALGAVNYPTPSPYFQPAFRFTVKEEVDWSSGSPRGPTVFIDMDDLGAAFE